MNCPLCGLPIGVGSLSNIKSTGLISFNVQVSVTVYNDEDTQERCLGHASCEYLPGTIDVPQSFQEAFGEGELDV